MKKFLAMALSLAMVLSLAACGSKTEAPAENTDAPAESDTTDASESTAVSGCLRRRFQFWLQYQR